MTALVLGLMAGMAVGSDETERISTETEERLLGVFRHEGERLTIRFGDQTRLVLEQVEPPKK